MSAEISMIERATEFGASAAVPLSGGENTQLTAGDMLRQAREAHGLHLEVVAAALKVPTQKLAALEADQIEALPDPVFARALAASVCRALRVDPAPVLAKLPGAPKAGLAEADRTMSGNIRMDMGHAGGWRPSRPLLAVVGLLLVAAAVLFWLPPSTFEQLNAAVSKLSAREGAETSPPAEAGAPAAGVVEPVAPNPAPAASTPVAAAAVPPAAAAAAPAEPAAAKDPLVFNARADTWINVSDANGKVLLRRIVSTGETVGVSGPLPMAVVVGRASGVEVQVRGQPFDLAPLTKPGGVARFEVKP